jgi:hypothetical protein
MMSTGYSRRRIWRPFTLTLTGESSFSGIVYVGVTAKIEPGVARLISAASERGVTEFLSLFAGDVRLELDPRTFRSAHAARMAAREMVLNHIDRLGADKVLNRTHLGSGYWSTVGGLKKAHAYRLDAGRIKRARVGSTTGAHSLARQKTPSGVPFKTIEAARALGFHPLALVWLMWAAPSTPTRTALMMASQRPTGRLQVLALALAHVMRRRRARSDVAPTSDDEATAEKIASLENMLSLLRQAWESDESLQ